LLLYITINNVIIRPGKRRGKEQDIRVSVDPARGGQAVGRISAHQKIREDNTQH